MRYRFTRVVVALVFMAVTAVAVTSAPDTSSAAPGDDVRLNEIQVVGSHNSYKVLPSTEELALIRGAIQDGADLMQYEHAPLPTQFESQKVRQIELDVWVDSAGGRFSLPLLRDLLGLGAYHPEVMDEPGLKVFHVQDVDYATTCLTLVACLEQVKAWSDANPGHVPISILVELKDSALDLGGLPFTVPEPWTPAALDELDADIRSVFGPDDMITPDDVRGSAPTLREAVTTTGWPTLGESRGKVMFLMDNDGGLRHDYLTGHPSLAGRVVFTNAAPGADDAAFLKRNNAFDASIPDLVADGFIVRTRADGDTVEARTNDTSRRDAALASGAQMVSTDYPVPGMAVGFTTSYVAELPGGTVARCNPINGPQSCVDGTLDLVGQTPTDPPPGSTPTSLPPRPHDPTSSTVVDPTTPGAPPSSTVPSPTSTPDGSSGPTTPTLPDGEGTVTTTTRPRGSGGTGPSADRRAPQAPRARPRPAVPSYTG